MREDPEQPYEQSKVGIAQRGYGDARETKNRTMAYPIKVGGEGAVLRPKMKSLQIREMLTCIVKIS